MLGERVSVRKVGSRVVVVNRPVRKTSPLSEKQVLHQEKFRQAVHYANQQMDQEESRSMYDKVATEKKSAFIVALSDYLNEPKIGAIDPSEYNGTPGSTILIKAVDDFMVTGVKVVITDSDGNVLEKGDASPTPTLYMWNYTATVINPSVKGTIIKAVATDRPGNKGSLEVTA